MENGPPWGAAINWLDGIEESLKRAGCGEPSIKQTGGLEKKTGLLKINFLVRAVTK